MDYTRKASIQRKTLWAGHDDLLPLDHSGRPERKGAGAAQEGQRRRGADVGRSQQRDLVCARPDVRVRLHLPEPLAAGALWQDHCRSGSRGAVRLAQHVAVIGKQDIVAAGDEADVRAACAERLAHGGVARADGHVDALHVIALFQQLRLEQRLERFGRRRDLIGVRIRGERDLQTLDRLRAAGRSGVLLAAAGHQAERQDQRQHHCHYFFHVHTLQIFSFRRPQA